MSLVIRPAQPDDCAAIAKIYDYYVVNTTITYEENPPTADQMAQRLTQIQSLGMPYLVAIVDERVVGYCYIGSFRTRAAYRYIGEHAIYLDPDYRKAGYGGPMMAALLSAAEKTGLRQLIAVIGGRDNHASLAFHEKFGFKKAGILEGSGYKFGRWIDTVLMQKDIEGGRTTQPDGNGLIGLV